MYQGLSLFHPGCTFTEKLVLWLGAKSTELRVIDAIYDFQTLRLQDRKTKFASEVLGSSKDSVSVRVSLYPERTKVATSRMVNYYTRYLNQSHYTI